MYTKTFKIVLSFIVAAFFGLTAQAQFSLTLIHNNDAESQLVSASGQPDFGGAARFKALVDQERNAATTAGRAVVVVTSGDNYIPSPEFNASIERDPSLPFYDAELIAAVYYDALCLGNHDFDFGPDVLADLINDVKAINPTPFLSANLDFSGEPSLNALVGTNDIASSIIVNKNGRDIGIIGLTTPNLPSIASPGNVVVDPNVVAAAQNEVNALTTAGVDIIILISHLQGITEDRALISQVQGIDIVVAGGGDELLANAPVDLVPGDAIEGAYPALETDLVGTTVPVVTTAGELKYIGRLDAEFDASGNLTSFNGNAIRVSGVAPDAVTPDAALQSGVVDSVAAFVNNLANIFVATTQVDLDGRRSTVRFAESNQGSLVANALLSAATNLAPSFGVGAPDVALANGGGIRNNNIIGAGSNISVLNTFDISPFGNLVSVVENVSPEQFKEILENAYSRFEDPSNSGTGRFAQIAGFSVEVNINGQAQQLDNNLNVTQPGTRVLNVTLDNGTKIVENGQVLSSAPSINVVLPDFLARGGDQYPIRNTPFTVLGISDQQALRSYLENDLGGVVTASQFPAGGAGQLNIVNQAELFIDPANVTAGEGTTFTVNVELRTGTQQVDGFFIDLEFDPTKLQIVSTSEQATAEFPVNLISPTVNNSNGTLRYSRGTFSNFPNDSLSLLTIEFSAIADTVETPISFFGFTDVTFNGFSVLGNTVGGVVEILDRADLTINYSLQGRTDFSGTENGNFFTVRLYEPGTSNLLFDFPGLNGTPGGQLNITNVIAQEVDVWVKHTKYLARLGNTTLVGGANSVNAGELRAGDANNDNLVLLTDFSILSGTFGLFQGDFGYNENADFNGDGNVLLVDFSLLVTNFNSTGSVPGGTPVFRVPSPVFEINNEATVNLAFDQEFAQPGDIVKARLFASSGDQMIDGVEAHLGFNPEVMEVVGIELGNTLDVELANAYDNQAGIIDLAAGTFGAFPAGNVEVATISFRVKAAGAAQVGFVNRGGLKSDVTFGGQSIFGGTEVSAFTATPTSVEEKLAAGLSVYPSPAKDVVTVKLNAPEAKGSYTMRVFNTTGQLMIQREVAANAEAIIELNGFSEGIYRVQLTDGKIVATKTFAVQR